MTSLWASEDDKAWRAALERYSWVVERQKVAKLPELDHWYHEELPGAIASRKLPHVELPELVRLTEWKMARGVWRAPNLVLVRGNAPALVIEKSIAAFAAVPHATSPIATLATLAGVGPATASAAVAAFAPDRYPFFDELVAQQVPSLGTVAWTLGFYAKYAEAIRVRAAQLGDGWTPAMVASALWANVGGKARAI